MTAAVAKIGARMLGKRVALILESHGDFEESLFMHRPMHFQWAYRFLMRRATRFSTKQADLLRAVSNSTRQQLERWVSEKPLVQFPTWTDMEVFVEAGETKKLAFPQEIVCACALIPRKGVHHLINAFAAIARDFPGITLAIIGHEENKAYSDMLREQARTYDIVTQVRFIAGVSQLELASWMKRAYVFVLPTYSEGLPRVIFEAMATGTPVIATAVSGIPEIVQDEWNGCLVPVGDEEALAGRLRWVLTNPVKVQEMGCRAHNFARSFFSTESYLSGYKQLFDKARAWCDDAQHTPAAL
jgi:glycosyltransferase involved in cell wall biosynthesis